MKRNEGITIIALIITIVILFIIAGVTTSVLTKGTFNKAKNTVAMGQNTLDKQKGQEEYVQEDVVKYPGKPIKSGTESPATHAPTGSIETSNVTNVSATITIDGQDVDEDSLTYTLRTEKSGETTKQLWGSENQSSQNYSLNGLTPGTKYTCYATISDGEHLTNISGSFKTNGPPTGTIQVPNKTAETAKVTVAGNDPDNDTLTYTLKIKKNGTTTNIDCGTNNTGVFDLSNLAIHKKYYCTATIKDIYNQTATVTGEFTTTVCTAVHCPNGRQLRPDEVHVFSPDVTSWIYDYTADNTSNHFNNAIHGTCTSVLYQLRVYSCNTCGGSVTTIRCRKCNKVTGIGGSSALPWPVNGIGGPYASYCTSMGGIMVTDTWGIDSDGYDYICQTTYGGIYYNVLCNTHNYTGDHYYCDVHGYVGTASTHE